MMHFWFFPRLLALDARDSTDAYRFPGTQRGVRFEGRARRLRQIPGQAEAGGGDFRRGGEKSMYGRTCLLCCRPWHRWDWYCYGGTGRVLTSKFLTSTRSGQSLSFTRCTYLTVATHLPATPCFAARSPFFGCKSGLFCPGTRQQCCFFILLLLFCCHCSLRLFSAIAIESLPLLRRAVAVATPVVGLVVVAQFCPNRPMWFVFLCKCTRKSRCSSRSPALFVREMYTKRLSLSPPSPPSLSLSRSLSVSLSFVVRFPMSSGKRRTGKKS